MGGCEKDEEFTCATFLQTVNETLGIEQKWSAVKEYSSENPVTTLFIIAIMVMCSVPIFCFFAFLIGSFIIGFTVFLFVEGTLATLATFFLGGSLFFAGLLSVGFSVFVVLSFYCFNMAQKIINRISDKFSSSNQECDSTQK